MGDVAGKGVSAATLTMLVQNTIKSFISQGYRPAKVMSKTNAVIMRAVKMNDFVTAFLGIIDVRSGQVTYCNGGHPPALLLRKDHVVESLSTPSPLVGAFPGLDYSEGVAHIEPSDALVLYTDGVIEARNLEGNLFGEDGLRAALSELKQPLSPREIPNQLFQTVNGFSGGRLTDDLAIMAVSLRR